ESERPGSVGGSLVLPLPPVAPRGEWKAVDLLGAFRTFHPSWEIPPAINRWPETLFTNEPVDPDEFYCKESRSKPGVTFSLECSRWRHGGEVEPFVVQLYFDTAADFVAGA